MSATSDAVTVAVPDIGDFQDVPIIEILVSAGDTVALDDPLLTLESDKATMDVPAPTAGTVRELLVKVGDKVSQGVELLTVSPSSDGDRDGGGGGAAPSTAAKAAGSVAEREPGRGASGSGAVGADPVPARATAGRAPASFGGQRWRAGVCQSRRAPDRA